MEAKMQMTSLKFTVNNDKRYLTGNNIEDLEFAVQYGSKSVP